MTKAKKGSPSFFQINSKIRQKTFPRFFHTTSRTRHTGALRLFQTTLKIRQKRSPTFFQATSTNRYQGSLRFFQTTVKINQNGSPKLLQTTSKTTHGILKILSNYFRKQAQKFPGSLSNYLKKKTWTHEIISNYFQKKTRNPQDSLKLLRIQNTRGLRYYFIILQKPDTKNPNIFSGYSKNHTPGIADILSNYFKKKKTKRVPEIL